jgi:hypothetical protein
VSRLPAARCLTRKGLKTRWSAVRGADPLQCPRAIPPPRGVEDRNENHIIF